MVAHDSGGTLTCGSACRGSADMPDRWRVWCVDVATQLVHVTGRVNELPPLTDSEFGVSARGLQLKRDVEMYQVRCHGWRCSVASARHFCRATVGLTRAFTPADQGARTDESAQGQPRRRGRDQGTCRV